MTSVAVVAHRNKTLGGGLAELRQVLTEKGVPDPIWYEVSKSRKAPKLARQAVADGADLLFIWGGEVLRGFAFTMLIGVITGTYSSIFVASAIAYDWLERDKKKNVPQTLTSRPGSENGTRNKKKIAATA